MFQITVCGVAAVDAVLAAHPERVDRFFFSKERSARYGDFCSRLANDKKIYRMVDESELEKITDSVHHQGVAAVVQYPMPRIPEPADVAAWGQDGRTILVLDGVSNTHNLGTMARTAAFLGIQDIVVCGKTTQAARIINPSMYRSAEGGMEYCTIWRHDSAAAFLKAYPFQGSPGLMAIAADHYANTEVGDIPAKIARLPGAGPDGRLTGMATAIVMGNEEEGLSKATKAACLFSARISGNGQLESLNVAQAAAIFMYWFARPSGAKPAAIGNIGGPAASAPRPRHPAGRPGASGRPGFRPHRDGEHRPARPRHGDDARPYREDSGRDYPRAKPFSPLEPGKKVRTVRLKKKPEPRQPDSRKGDKQ